jgi:Tfp pilus assembly protein PilX
MVMVRKGCILFLLASTLAIAQATTLDSECLAADESCSATEDQHGDEEASFPAMNEECKDTDDHCAFWASSGECTANPN